MRSTRRPDREAEPWLWRPELLTRIAATRLAKEDFLAGLDGSAAIRPTAQQAALGAWAILDDRGT
jgi:hypothetical protein